MTTEEELKILAVRYRWAWEDLVADAKFIEANRIACEGLRAGYLYIKAKKGPRTMAYIHGMLQEYKRPTPEVVSIKAERKRLYKEEMWVFDTCVMQIKTRQARRICETVQGMFRYLIKVYGSPKQLLKMLRWIVRMQSGPSKSLHLLDKEQPLANG